MSSFTVREMIATAVTFTKVHCLSRKGDSLGNHIEVGKQLCELVISELYVEDHRDELSLTGPDPPV